MTNQIKTNKSFFLAAGPLLLVLFIDGMGLGLVFPIINALVMDPNASLISVNTSPNIRNLIFGFTIGVFMLCWFFGAAFLGDLSDQIGRKKTLLICLLGGFLGYVLSTIAVSFNSLLLLLLGRMIAGFTSGSQPIAQAAIVDISPKEHKARNIGWILFALSLGFIVGPLLGGLLSDRALFSGFNYGTPFLFASIISLINACLLLILFKETFTRPQKLTLKLHRAIEIFISAFRHEKVRELSFIFLVFIFGWSSFYTFVSMFLFREYQFSALENGLFMALMGVGFGCGTGFFVEFCTKRYALKKIVIINAILAAIFVFITLYFQKSIFAWMTVAPLGAVVAIAYSVSLTIFSNQVDATAQGWIMGITGAIMAFAFGINGILAGIMADVGARVPLVISCLGLFISAIMMYFLYHEKSSNVRTP